MRRDVARTARVCVRPPRPAEPVVTLEDHEVLVSSLAQPDRGADAAESRADDRDANVPEPVLGTRLEHHARDRNPVGAGGRVSRATHSSAPPRCEEFGDSRRFSDGETRARTGTPRFSADGTNPQTPTNALQIGRVMRSRLHCREFGKSERFGHDRATKPHPWPNGWGRRASTKALPAVPSWSTGSGRLLLAVEARLQAVTRSLRWRRRAEMTTPFESPQVPLLRSGRTVALGSYGAYAGHGP